MEEYREFVTILSYALPLLVCFGIVLIAAEHRAAMRRRSRASKSGAETR